MYFYRDEGDIKSPYQSDIMSIRPADYGLISKSQEVTKIAAQNNKFKVQIEQGVIQQDKQIKKILKGEGYK